MIKSRLSYYFSTTMFLTIAHGVIAQQVLPRENIKVFSQDPVKVQKFRDAVASLQARKFDDSTSWFTQAGIHDIRSNDPNLGSVPSAIKALFHQCHKNETLFFLWHRAYVAAVERLLQDAIHDANFRLPYWDWYSDPSLPDMFRSEFVDSQHTKRNPLYIKDRNAPPGTDINGGDPVWTPEVITDFTNNSFAAFQDQLNQNEHGDIHVFVGTGTNMGSIVFAARDPIFYLHHVNIDRLLMVWLKASPSAHKVPTSFPKWLKSVYRFPISPGSTGNANPPVNTPTVQELALGSIEAMGYTYDNLDLPAPTPPAVPTAPQNLQVATVPAAGTPQPKSVRFAAAAAPEKPLEVGAAGTIQLSVEAKHKENIRMLANMTPSPQTEAGLSLVFENIHLKETPPGLASYRVFVNLPKEGGSGETFRDYFVGTLSLFNLEHAEAQGHSTVTLHFSPTQGAPALTKALDIKSDATVKINVSLIPVLAPGASPPKKPVLSIGQIRLEGITP